MVSRSGSAPRPSLSTEVAPHQPQQNGHHGNRPRYCRTATKVGNEQGTPDTAREDGDSKCQQTKADDAQSASSERTLFLHLPPQGCSARLLLLNIAQIGYSQTKKINRRDSCQHSQHLQPEHKQGLPGSTRQPFYREEEQHRHLSCHQQLPYMSSSPLVRITNDVMRVMPNAIHHGNNLPTLAIRLRNTRD